MCIHGPRGAHMQGCALSLGSRVPSVPWGWGGPVASQSGLTAPGAGGPTSQAGAFPRSPQPTCTAAFLLSFLHIASLPQQPEEPFKKAGSLCPSSVPNPPMTS